MQKLVLKLLVCACIGSLCSCAQPAQPEEETLYVSILPLKSIVGGIVGDDFDVRVLVPAGASPETFEPTPRQFVDLNRARLIFNVGLIDFETTLLGKIEARDKVVDLSRGIDLIAGSCSHAHNKVARADEPHAAAMSEEQQTAGTAATPEEQQTAGSHAAAMPGERQLAGRHAATPAPQAHGHSHAHGIDPHIWTSRGRCNTWPPTPTRPSMPCGPTR